MCTETEGGVTVREAVDDELVGTIERVRISMPQNSPGSLSGQQNADILAFVFSSNKFPAGEMEMPKEAGILKTIKFEVKKP